MAFKFPSFDKGDTGTLLDAVHAKTVKRFIEAWNSIQVILTDKSSLNVSDKNVVLQLNVGPLTEATETAQATADEAMDILDTDTARAATVLGSSDGQLVSVVTHGAAGGGGYQTTLELRPATYHTVRLGKNLSNTAKAAITVEQSNSSYIIFDADSGLWQMQDTSTLKTFAIDKSLLTQNMSIREIDVCDSGTAKKMLIVGSASYTP